MSDDKVNMSLDDIIRLQKKNTKPGTTPSSTRKVVRRTGASALQVNVRGRGGIAKKRTGGPGGAGTSSASNTPQRRTVVRRGVPAGRGRKVVGAGIRRRPATAAVNANVADRQATKRLVQNLVKKALKRQTGRPVLASPVVRAVTAPSPFVLGGRGARRGGGGRVVNVASRAMARLSGVSNASRVIRRRVAPARPLYTARGIQLQTKPQVVYAQAPQVVLPALQRPRIARQVIAAPQRVQVVQAGPTRAERRAVARARRAGQQQVVVVNRQPRIQQQPMVIRRGGGGGFQRPRSVIVQNVVPTQRVRVQQAPQVQYVTQAQPVRRPRIQQVQVVSRQERNANLAAALNIVPSSSGGGRRRQEPARFSYYVPAVQSTVRRGRGFRQADFF